MTLIYLKEGRNYTAQDLLSCIGDRLSSGVPDWLNEAWLEGLKASINAEFGKSVVKGKTGKYVFHYIGLYDYTEEGTDRNLTFFFLPKFIDFQKGSDCDYGDEDEVDVEPRQSADRMSWCGRLKVFSSKDRDSILRAIDRYNNEENELASRIEGGERRKESILGLAVRFLRDYLANGMYTVQRRELERNGQGEIDWDSTIDQFQPMIKEGRPYYMDVWTEQACSNEDHYITRLQKCLVTAWGRKLEELGLSSALCVNVPPLSEEELEHLGDTDYQIAQIDKELSVQFVTRSRETLGLMKELIQRSVDAREACHERLSFGMTGVEHLWERACAEVLGTELDKKICECGFPNAPQGVTFSKYMPRIFWTNLFPSGGDESAAKQFNADKGSQRSKKAGWRLDFIRTWRPDPKGKAEKLVILDAKYYCARWKDGSISGQPGTPDIAKQMFYQMAFKDLIDNSKIVNTFLLPEDDHNPRYKLGHDVKITETVRLEARQKADGEFDAATAFADINLFTVRIPGIRLLERYANSDVANDWFEKIVGFDPSTPAPKGVLGIAQ